MNFLVISCNDQFPWWPFHLISLRSLVDVGDYQHRFFMIDNLQHVYACIGIHLMHGLDDLKA